jgi:amidase
VLGLSTQGAITRTVRDSAALLDVMSGYEPGDAFVPAPPATSFLDAADRTPARCRFALALEPPVDVPLDPTCAGPATALADLLTELGHERIEGAPPWEDVRAEFLNVWRMGPAVSGVEPDVLEPINRALAEDALATSSAELGRAVVRLQGYARTIVAFWNDVDVVVTPTLAQPPVPIGWHFEAEDPREQFDRAYLFTPYTATVNVTGQPAASVPFTTGPDGLPRGVQLIGKPLREEQLLSLCAQIEEARPWRDRTPPLAKLG